MDIVGQVLNFGLPAPIDVQVRYPDLNRAYAVARTLRDRMREVPGAVDVTVKQVLDYPTLFVDVDCQRAAEVGISQRDAANSMLVSLSSSVLVAPSYFVNPANQVNYPVAVEVALPKMTSAQDVLATPVTPGVKLDQQMPPWAATNPQPRAPTETLDNIARMSTTAQPAEVDHYTVARVLDVTANVEGRDLGSVVAGIQRSVDALGPLPPGMSIAVRGRARSCTMHSDVGTGLRRCGRARLLPHGSAVSVVGRAARNHGSGAGGCGGDSVDARGDSHEINIDVLGSIIGRRHRRRQLDPRGELRQRPAHRARHVGKRGRHRVRASASASG